MEATPPSRRAETPSTSTGLPSFPTGPNDRPVRARGGEALSLRAGARCFAYGRSGEQSPGLYRQSESSELHSDEELLVLDWRTEQFRMLGFDRVHAQPLAECGALISVVFGA